ncbi:uncharacterized protein [Aegilops tauschii subsp. strangulata]|uniref:uncharacterized protein n=1 Tax=Aegilops tauschii subsp. strangulata TaxID=200361 RepID=UPI00098AF531|nr:uncharacterized protein LOC109742238 [Aegilops tauschii subsp. strangulata]
MAILDAPPAPPIRPRSSAPPKVRATSAPSRRSARKATSGCTVPVAQRAALRLVQELGGLGPKDRMTPAAAAALLKRFEEPLSRSDIKAHRPGQIMSWNVRGLNAPARRSAVREVAQTNNISILNLQETKLETWTLEMARDVGGSLLQGCVVLPAMGTRGGAAIFWDKQIVEITDQIVASFSITAKVKIISTGCSFWMTTVYGPTDDQQKANFLSELAAVAPPATEPWMLNGDFNMIYQARDKNNCNINRRMMGRFRRAIDLAGVKEVKCKNRRFTWSSEREDPTLCSIDKVFCNLACEDMHPSFVLMAASTSFSDHCPLVLANGVRPVTKARFRFENFWTVFPHFQETVQHAWERPIRHDCPFVRMKKKMERVAVDLKQLKGLARSRLPGFLGSAREMPTQSSSMPASSRVVEKNYIHSIKKGDAIVMEPREKAQLAFDHFARGLSESLQQNCTLNWDLLQLPAVDLQGIDLPFCEPEIWAAIKAFPTEKAPVPDGYTGKFFRSCWHIIKQDIMAVFQKFYNLAGDNFADLNTAFIALLPKKDGATEMGHFRLISLHC